MIWSEEMLCKFSMMREAGFSKHEISAELGSTAKSKRNKHLLVKKKGKRTMSNYPEKKVGRIDPYEFWSIYDELRNVKEVAAYFGVSVQTVYNRISKGRPKTAPADTSTPNRDGLSETVQSDCVSQSNEKGDKKMEDMTVCGLYKNTKGARTSAAEGQVDICECVTAEIPEKDQIITASSDAAVHTIPEEHKKKDILDLVHDAKYMASAVGFEPDHLMVDLDQIRTEIIVSGKDQDGKVHELQYSVTNPIFFGK